MNTNPTQSHRERKVADVQRIFDAADKDLRANTAYPVFREEFRVYKDPSADLFEGVSALSFYIHIPFCRQLCSFCEYTRFLAGNERDESRYLALVENQADEFVRQYPQIKTLCGFDIGGGTPTALSDANFRALLDLQQRIESGFSRVGDFEKSIEISLSTVSEEKLKMIYAAGFRRISTGLQSINKALMRNLNRYYTNLDNVVCVRERASELGIREFNIDLMYGLPGQDEKTIEETLKAVSAVNPEQVTLYETRYNNNKISSAGISREIQYAQYRQLYAGLSVLGYRGNFGQNAFSNDNSPGVSSYLKYRMHRCVPYKGFGIAAQSMSLLGLAYNALKDTSEKKIPAAINLNDGDTYRLPREEIAAKYIGIAMYSGSFRLDVLEEILGEDPQGYFSQEIRFLTEKNIMQKRGDVMRFTEHGFRFYGAAAALFWSDVQKARLLSEAE